MSAGYYERYNAIFTSIAILILTVVFLLILKDYHYRFHLKILEFVKKYNRFLIYIVIFIFLIMLIWVGLIWYENIKEKQVIKTTKEKFHNSEFAYQKCLDKAATQNREINSELDNYRVANKDYSYDANEMFKFFLYPDRAPDSVKKYFKGLYQIENKSYFYQWSEAKRPGFNDQKGFWEVFFIRWMIKKYPEFCKEYDTGLINLGLSHLPYTLVIARNGT